MAGGILLLGMSVLAICSAASSAAATTTTLDISDASTSTRAVPVTLSFPIARSNDLGFDVVLNYHAIDGTALAGTDYVAPSSPSILPAGAAASTIPVQLFANTSNAAAQTFQLRLDAAFGVGNAPAFATQQLFGTGAAPGYVLAADINGDGKPDLVILNQTDQNISVLLNTTAPGASTSTFAAQQTFPAGAFPVAIGVADINGDGKPDVIAVNLTAGGISILMNTTAAGATTATFGTQPLITIEANVIAVAAADLNGDGRVDLVVASPSNDRVAVLRNTTAPGAATASFAVPVFFDSGDYPSAIGVYDLNGDGKPDLVAVNYLASTISVLLNTTDVTSTALTFSAKADFTTGTHPVAVKAADLNGDGLPDIIVANQDDATVSVFGNTMAPGAITASLAAAQAFAVGATPSGVVVLDINADGKPDIITTNFNSNTVSVLRNITASNAAQFHFSAQVTFATGTSPAAVAAADVNGDGKLDLAVVNRNSSNLSVLLNTTVASAATVAFGALQPLIGLNSANSLAIADFNGDGKPDFVMPDGNSSFLSYLNTTVPGATAATFHLQQFAASLAPSGIAAADINGDGKPDVIVSNLSSDSISVSLDTTPVGATTATFASAKLFTADEHPMGVCVADFNGDGKPDVATGTFDGSTVSVFLNTTVTGASIPTFAAKQSFATGNHDQAIACGDLNGDGKADIVVANASDNTVSVRRNTTAVGAATATFATQQTFATGSTPSGVTIADVNGDGQPDILVADLNPGAASVLLNTTTPGATTFAFGTHTDFTTGSGASWVAAADVDGDGKLDILVANRFAHSVSVLINTAAVGASSADFAAPTALQTNDDPMAVALVDFNGDGHADILTANASASASVLLSRRFQALINTGTAIGTINHDDIFADGFE
jgi:FG-GAP-like repeat/FG-GAP repeat